MNLWKSAKSVRSAMNGHIFAKYVAISNPHFADHALTVSKILRSSADDGGVTDEIPGDLLSSTTSSEDGSASRRLA